MEISFCASSLRRSETSASRANNRRFQRITERPLSRIASSVAARKTIDLALHPIVDLHDALAGLLFVFAVLHQQSCHGRAQRGLPLLQRKLNLLTRFFFLAIVRESEHAVDGIPELSERSR